MISIAPEAGSALTASTCAGRMTGSCIVRVATAAVRGCGGAGGGTFPGVRTMGVGEVGVAVAGVRTIGVGEVGVAVADERTIGVGEVGVAVADERTIDGIAAGGLITGLVASLTLATASGAGRGGGWM